MSPSASRVAPEAREEALGPAAGVEVLDALRHRLEPALTFARRQRRARSRAGRRRPSTSHGLTSSAPGKHLRRTGELGEEQRAAPATGEPGFGLAEDELVRDEVHAVAKRGDHHHVGSPIERDERVLRDVAVDVLDRRRPRLSVPAVDPRDQKLDLVPLRAELGALEPRRDEHLDHRGRSRAVRVALEEALVRLELLRDALGVVEALHAEDRACGPRTAAPGRRGDGRSRDRRASRGSPRRRSRSGRRRCRPSGRRSRASRAPSRCRGSAGTTSGSGARSRRSGS